MMDAVRGDARRRNPSRAPWAQNTLIVLIALAVTLAGVEAVLRVFTRDGEFLGTRLVGPHLIDHERIRHETPRLMTVYDRGQGWTGMPDGGTSGVRGDRYYAPRAPEGVMRVCAFGESFTYGDQVSAAESWPSQLEAQAGGRLEVLNFGVGGYGLDQAYVCFRRHAPALHPDVVLAGLTPYALQRLTNLYHPFYSPETGIAFVKPRFALERGALRQVMVEMPHPAAFLDEIAAFGSHPLRPYERYYDPAIFESSWVDRSHIIWFARSRWAWQQRRAQLALERVMAAGSEEVALARALLVAMDEETRAMGGRLAVVILPTPRALGMRSEGQDLWAPLERDLESSGIAICDARASLGESGFRRYFLPDGHLNPAGNGRVAEVVAQCLEAHVPAASVGAGVGSRARGAAR